jgi:hypothetical protein
MLPVAGVVTKPPLVSEVNDFPDLRSGKIVPPWHEIQFDVKTGCISADNDQIEFGSTVVLVIFIFSHDERRTNITRINPAEITLHILIDFLSIQFIVN